MSTAPEAPILAIIPGYNEAPRIAPVIEAALRHLPVVVVDDGSRDGTAEMAGRAGGRAPRSSARSPTRQGRRAPGRVPACARGARPAIVTLDVDNQSGYRLIGAELLPRLLDSAETGFEFAVEMMTTAIRGGATIDRVPIRTIHAGEPSHIRPVQHVVGLLRVAREARRTVRTPMTGRPPSNP